jgi:radical SAM protein with 4Fe4S-binding SPASM domain
MGMRFKFNSALTRWNENELEGIFAIADSYGVTLQIDPIVTPRDNGDTEPMTVAATSEGLREFARIQSARSKKGKALKLDRPIQDDDLPRTSSEKHCGAGSLTIAIDPYGNVYPCVAWRVASGNLRDASIREIWANATGLALSREGTKAAKDMLDGEGELGKYVSFCPGLAVNRNGRPDVIPAEQRKQGLTLQKAFEEETEKA